MRTSSDLIKACETGDFIPLGPRVLVEAYVPSAESKIIVANETMTDYNRGAIYHVVKSVGPGVPSEFGLEPNMKVHHISAAADQIVAGTKGSKFLVVHYEDIVGFFRG